MKKVIKKALNLAIVIIILTKQTIIERTVKIINQLPEDKAEEISFLLII